jgi:hypothetical protein
VSQAVQSPAASQAVQPARLGHVLAAARRGHGAGAARGGALSRLQPPDTLESGTKSVAHVLHWPLTTLVQARLQSATARGRSRADRSVSRASRVRAVPLHLRRPRSTVPEARRRRGEPCCGGAGGLAGWRAGDRAGWRGVGVAAALGLSLCVARSFSAHAPDGARARNGTVQGGASCARRTARAPAAMGGRSDAEGRAQMADAGL